MFNTTTPASEITMLGVAVGRRLNMQNGISCGKRGVRWKSLRFCCIMALLHAVMADACNDVIVQPCSLRSIIGERVLGLFLIVTKSKLNCLCHAHSA